jgi:hypothetical protein
MNMNDATLNRCIGSIVFELVDFPSSVFWTLEAKMLREPDFNSVTIFI